ELFCLDVIDDVRHERIERDVPGQLVLALAEPRECGRGDAMAEAAKRVRDGPPAPSAVPGAMHQHVGLGSCPGRGLGTLHGGTVAVGHSMTSFASAPFR